MDDDRHPEEWSEEERAALAALPRPAGPPAGLEAKIVRELQQRGELRPTGGSRAPRIAAVVAAALVLFAMGVASERWLFRSVDTVADAERFTHMLMLYRSPASLSRSQGVSNADAYATWARENVAVVGGEELAPGSEWLEPQEAIDGPILVGYFLIEAEDDLGARSIAASCPHLSHGSIEIRRIRRR